MIIKKTFFMLIFLSALSLSFITAGASKEAVKPVIENSSNSIQLFPKETYSTEYWRTLQKLQDTKSPQNVSIKFPQDDETPSGEPCVEMVFNGNDGRVYSPEIEEKGTWRSLSYNELHFWIKGNEDGKKIKITVSTAFGGSSWDLPLVTNQWEKIILYQGTGYTPNKQRVDFNNIKTISFRQAYSSRVPLTFRVGGFELKETYKNIVSHQTSSVVIPLLNDSKIKLDGILNEDAWQKALPFECRLLYSKDVPQEKSDVYLIADRENLYIGAKLFTKDTSKLVAFKKNRDDQIHFDDCFEILIDDTLDAKTYKHFKLNSIGSISDSHYRFDSFYQDYIRDIDWNPQWSHKNRLLDAEWDIEIAIPLKDAGITLGRPFCLQIGRENKQTNECSSIFPEARRFTSLMDFGLAVIGNNWSNETQPLTLSMKNIGQMQLSGTKMNGKEYSLTLTITDIYAKTQEKKLQSTVDKEGNISFNFDIEAPVEGTYRILIEKKCDGKKIPPKEFNFTMTIPSDTEYGDIKLNPNPKKMESLHGNFTFSAEVPIVIPQDATERTRKTARHLRTELHVNLLGILPAIVNSNKIDGKKILLTLRKDIKELPKKNLQEINNLPAEGYYLEISPGEIEIIGSDEAGLYYGVVTLIQYFRANLIKKQSTEVTCVRIIDWPDIQMRMVQHFPFPSLPLKKEHGHDINKLKSFIKNVLAGSKINYYCLQLRYEIELDKYARFTDVDSMMKMREWKEVAEFAKEHFIEFVPMFESAYRGENFIRKCHELQEPGYPRQINFLHEMWSDIIFNCYDDLLRPLKDTKYIMIRHDECWQKCDGVPTDSLNGIPKWKIFANDVIRNNDFFKARKIRPIIYADMLLNRINGGYPLNIAKAADLIPRDVILSNWSIAIDKNSTVELHSKGFDVIDTFNSFGIIPATDIPIIMGYSTLFYGHYLQTIGRRRQANQTQGVLRGADYSWNLKHDSQMPLDEWRRRYLKNIMPLYFFPERKILEWKSVKSIDLTKYANSSTGSWFGKPEKAPILQKGNSDFGFIPFSILSKSNDFVAPTAEKSGIEIDLPDGKIRSLFFLEGAYVEEGKRDALKRRGNGYSHGIPIGEIQIEYDDGPTEIQPLLIGYNINEICPEIETRFMYGVRYTHDIKSNDGTTASIYLMEWVNPYPERNVKKVIWKSYNLEAVPVLFAASYAK